MGAKGRRARRDGIVPPLTRTQRLDRFFGEISAGPGFQTPPADMARLIADPPPTARALAEEVVRLEGLEVSEHFGWTNTIHRILLDHLGGVEDIGSLGPGA